MCNKRLEESYSDESVFYRITRDSCYSGCSSDCSLFSWQARPEKQQEQQEKIDAMAQTVSILVIDKGRMKLKEAGFPSIVLESTPKYLRRSKVYVVKAKVGPKIMTFMCDDKVFPLIPVKRKSKQL